jgi:acyl-CoA thioester hydrolase
VSQLAPFSDDPSAHGERIRVRYGETDQMGHAYYGNYMLWLEQARGGWCRSRGFTYKSLEERGIKLPVVEMGVKYRGEVKYDDDIIVWIRMAEVRRASMKFEYEIFNETSGKRVTEAFTWHVTVGPEMKAISVPADLLQLKPGP